MREKKQDLDHQVWKQIKFHGLQDKKILLAFSGGADSLALLSVLSKIHPRELLGACYFHHGEDSNRAYRDKAEIFCRKKCDDLDVSFFSLTSMASARSEEQYRDLRYQAIDRLKKEQNFEVLVTGHHRDDLLETRLMRLVRGTGAQGLPAMHNYRAGLFRPLLEVTKAELVEYLKKEKLRPLEDPTNKNTDPFRNWVREKWLKSLEKRSPGSVSTLARSLETVSHELSQQVWGDLLNQNEAYKSQGLRRSFYLTLSSSEQKRLLAQYLFSLGKKDFSQAHLEEIRKRLDKTEKVITFKVAGCVWNINAQQIKVES